MISVQWLEFLTFVVLFFKPVIVTWSFLMVAAILLFLTALGGLLFGLLVSILTSSSLSAFMIAQYVSYPIAFISGECCLSSANRQLWHLNLFRCDLAHRRTPQGTQAVWTVFTLCITHNRLSKTSRRQLRAAWRKSFDFFFDSVGLDSRFWRIVALVYQREESQSP